MMKAGLEGLTGGDDSTGAEDEKSGAPVVSAVTQLTSTDQETLNNELLIDGDMNDVIVKYALNAKAAGLGGVVCSPLEAGIIHKACGDDFLTVTPGIRFAGGDAGDQARITTPAKARELGSDYIVIGRPITQADDPVKAYNMALEDFLGE